MQSQQFITKVLSVASPQILFAGSVMHVNCQQEIRHKFDLDRWKGRNVVLEQLDSFEGPNGAPAEPNGAPVEPNGVPAEPIGAPGV